MLNQARKDINVLFHIFFWTAYVGLEFSLLLVLDTQQKIYTHVPFSLFHILIFYVYSLILFDRFLSVSKFFVIVLSIVAFSFASSIYIYYLCKLFIQWGIPAQVYTYGQSYLVAMWWVVVYMLYALAYWFFKSNLIKEREKRITEQTLREQEKHIYELNSKLYDAELAYLRSQINPHFLYNSLNFFYSEVYEHSPEAAKGVLLLVDIFKYALKENDFNGKVELDQEIKHVENFIAFNQLRYKNSLNIILEKEGNFKYRSIIPLIIINFIENLFKHADLHDPKNPASIRINIFRNDFSLFIRNKIRHGPKEKSTGIGIENTQKRLEMTYGKNANLAISNDGEFYQCLLTITL